MSNIGLLLLRWRYGGYGCEDNLHLLNVQINVSYSNSVYELRQEASKMKTLIILLLFSSNHFRRKLSNLLTQQDHK